MQRPEIPAVTLDPSKPAGRITCIGWTVRSRSDPTSELDSGLSLQSLGLAAGVGAEG